jgi:hypothetical protein
VSAQDRRRQGRGLSIIITQVSSAVVEGAGGRTGIEAGEDIKDSAANIKEFI